MLHRRTSLTIALLLTLPRIAEAQNFVPIVESGDNIAGVGNVTFIRALAVDDSGQVLVNVNTDHSNPFLNEAIVDSTHAALVKAGDSVNVPVGATIESFNGCVAVSASGVPAFWVRLAGTPNDEDGLYVGFPPTAGVYESQTCTASGIPAGSTFSILLAPKVNDSQRIAFHAMIDDPNVPGAFNFPALFTLDTTTGTQTLVAQRGDILPGQNFGIWEFEWDFLRLALNNSDEVFFRAQTYDNPNVQQVAYRNSTLIAQTGQVTSFGTYTSLASIHQGNNSGYVFLCDVSNAPAIVHSGSLFARELDCLPSIEPFKISELGEPRVGDDGRVVWNGTWDLPGGGQRTALFADYSILVEVGETTINGSTVIDLSPSNVFRSMSPSGQYFAFKATLENGTQGAYLVDFWQ